MSLAIGKVALVALPLLLVALGGGSAKADTSKVKAAYDAGFAVGKADKENGKAATSYAAPKTEEERAWVKGYADGYAAGVVKGVGGGGGGGGGKTVSDVIDTKPPTVSISDIELAASLGATDGYQRGKADAMSGKPSTPYAYAYSKGMPSNATLREAYQISYRSNYAEGYEEGQKLVATSGGGGDGFMPVNHYYDRNRPNGYPRNWYNY